MKITVDFDDLFKNFEDDESTVTQIVDEVKRRVIDDITKRITWAVIASIDKSNSYCSSIDKTQFDEIRTLANILIKKYEAKIKEDIKKVME